MLFRNFWTARLIYSVESRFELSDWVSGETADILIAFSKVEAGLLSFVSVAAEEATEDRKQ